MKPVRYARSVGLLMAMFLWGCVASFEPQVSSSGQVSSSVPTAKYVQEGLEVSVEEFVSANKSRHAFDADVASHGVLALYVRVENKGARDYTVRQQDIQAFLGEEGLAPIYGYKAAKRGARRDYVGKALVNTVLWGPLALYFGLPTMVASVAHTRSVNKNIEQHFQRLEFSDAVLKPGEAATGFAYFEMPKRLERLEALAVEINAGVDGKDGQQGEKIAYKFSLPALAVSRLDSQPSNGEIQGGNRLALDGQ